MFGGWKGDLGRIWRERGFWESGRNGGRQKREKGRSGKGNGDEEMRWERG
jgi:hypothetical protein